MNGLSGVEVVFLDAVGTLFKVKGSVGGIYSRIARSYGVETDSDSLEHMFAAAFRGKLAATPGVVATSEEEKFWWHEIVREVFGSRMSGSHLDAYFHEVFEFFRRAQAWELYEDTLDALETLKQGAYRIGIISNFDSRLNDLLQDLRIADYFDRVVLSWQTGAAKPDLRIFQTALEKMHVRGTEALHIGDSSPEDYQGARRAGMHAILLDRSGMEPARPYVARTLTEAVGKLNRKNRQDA